MNAVISRLTERFVASRALLTLVFATLGWCALGASSTADENSITPSFWYQFANGEFVSKGSSAIPDFKSANVGSASGDVLTIDSDGFMKNQGSNPAMNLGNGQYQGSFAVVVEAKVAANGDGKKIVLVSWNPHFNSGANDGPSLVADVENGKICYYRGNVKKIEADVSQMTTAYHKYVLVGSHVQNYNGTVYLYVDGVMMGSHSTDEEWPNTTRTAFSFGTSGNGTTAALGDDWAAAEGTKVKDFRVYQNTALTSAQVAAVNAARDLGTRVISYNVAQIGGAYGDGVKSGVVEAECATAVGVLPTNAWTQTQSYEYGNNVLAAGNVSYSNLTLCRSGDGFTTTTNTSLSVGLTQSTNISVDNNHSVLYPFLNANLSQKSGSDNCTATLTFSDIPFDYYDVIVYFAAATTHSGASLSGDGFCALKINNATIMDEGWGNRDLVESLVENQNYVKRLCTGTSLTISTTDSANSHYRGIAAVQIVERIVTSYVATISGKTTWAELSWTTNGVSAAAPAVLADAIFTIKGKGLVTGLDGSPLSLTLDEFVACDVTQATGTQFSGNGRFLVQASTLTEAKTFGSNAINGVIGVAEGGETASGTLTINCTPFYSYGNVTLSSATFSAANLNYYVPAEIAVESGCLTLSSVPDKRIRVADGATLAVNKNATVSMSGACGIYGEGTFKVVDGLTVDGGYFATSGKNTTKVQRIWTEHVSVGAGSTLKFTVMTNQVNTYITDALSRYTIGSNGKMEFYVDGNTTTPFATYPALLGTESADDYNFTTTGSQTMGYAGSFADAPRLANVGYDTAFPSAFIDAAHTTYAAVPDAEPYSISVFADIAASTQPELITIGSATRAIVLRAAEGLLTLCLVENGVSRPLGVIAPKNKGYHLYTITKSSTGVALYLDGKLMGIDFTATAAVSGNITLGTGLSLRMARIDNVILSATAIKALAFSWQPIENTRKSTGTLADVAHQVRVDQTWATAHLPADVVTPMYAEAAPNKNETDAFIAALQDRANNGRTYLECYLLGLNPDDTDISKNRAYINEVRFSADPVDFAHTNATVCLEYANPSTSTGINVTYRLQAKNGTTAGARDIPVTNGVATVRDLVKTGRVSTAYNAKTEIQPKLPNVIFVLADDLGYGDVGWTIQTNRAANGQCYISTPFMDNMVSNGCQMTAHYAAAPVCAPSRASILTGKHQGECSLRDNCFDFPILEERTIGTLMREAGYSTYAIGKWGVGGGGESNLPMVAHPLDRGFDHHYGFLDHGAGHTYYHYDGLLNGAYMGVVDDREQKTDTAIGIYSTDLYTARAKKVICDQVAANKANGTDKPFFMYLAINTIHGSSGNYLDSSVPTKKHLHVPGRSYPDANPNTAKKYGVGEGADWDWLQANRENRADRNTWLYDYTKNFDSDAAQSKARYATGITRLDEAMEDIRQTLVDLGIDKDTLIIFTSDNGPAGNEEQYGLNPDNFDSNAAFVGYKRDVKEGGMREPTFLYWPGHIPAGSVDDRPSMNSSWYSFLEQLVKSNAPGQLPEDVYTEYTHGTGNRDQIMVRIGDYVGLNTNIPSNTSIDNMELIIYNVVTDPSQSTALADDVLPDGLRARMRQLMKSYHTKWERSDGQSSGGGTKHWTRPYDTAQ